mgnify:CR=1 FL=1
MSKPDRTRNDKANQHPRERVIEAAIQVVGEVGVEGFTMRALGENLGVTQMMPYRHFRSKETLFVEIERQVSDRFGAYLEECANSGRTPETRLRRLCVGYIKYGCEAPADYEIIFNKWSDSAYKAVLEVDGPDALKMTRSWSAMLDAVADLRQAGRTDRKVRVASHILWESLHGLVNLHLSKKLGFGFSILELYGPVIDGLLQIAQSGMERNRPIELNKLPTVRPVITNHARSDDNLKP